MIGFAKVSNRLRKYVKLYFVGFAYIGRHRYIRHSWLVLDIYANIYVNILEPVIDIANKF
jgi:hypothetical protein